MATSSALLDSISGRWSPNRALLVSLGEIAQFSRAYWEKSVPLTDRRLSPEHCLVVRSSHIAAYDLRGSEGWADFRAIQTAFRSRESAGRKTGPLPHELVFGALPLIVRDRDRPIECLVARQPVYAKRAWVGLIDPELGPEWPYVIAGILNSAIGQVLYRRLLPTTAGQSRDIRKEVLTNIRVPYVGYSTESFWLAAKLSYRLHMLHEASRALALPAELLDVTARNHWLRLLSELVRLYGFPDPEAQQLVEDVLPEGLSDVPGHQGELFYVTQSPLEDVVLANPEDLERYEVLKAERRAGRATPSEEHDLERLQDLLEWEDRINRPVAPAALPPPTALSTEADALRRAHLYLSHRKGQSYIAERPRRIAPSLWEVDVFYYPPKRLRPEDILRVPAAWATPGRHSAGKLEIDATTGAVREVSTRNADAGASRA